MSAVESLLASWHNSPLARHFCCYHFEDARSPEHAPLPQWLDPRLRAALDRAGISQLFSHQARAIALASPPPLGEGRDVVVATPTASGKTLCYNLPVFETLLRDNTARALYLFPTKALARDQVEAARGLAREVGGDGIGVAVYDGDTPPDERRAARRSARIVATNPDMLHTSILPHHPAWAELLAGLRYVVVDELHVYRGVFGSHLAHVLRRLLRLARFHGAAPTFVFSSATIANPSELAERLIGRRCELVRDSGAPRGPRHFLIYNPPVVDAALGIRQSYLKATSMLTQQLISREISSLVFCRTRKAVEVLLRYLRDGTSASRASDAVEAAPVEQMIRGYRGGYLPDRRRNVERSLRDGQTRAVVATSALELGIDIGSLDAVVVAGWPGSRAALLQRAGRAGRRLAPSLALLVACSDPLDQFVAADPSYLLGQAVEHARVEPHNPSILVPHLKCAAYELPFAHDEGYGDLDSADTTQVLEALADAQLLHRGERGYHHVSDAYPANEVSLRGPADENFVVVLVGEGAVSAPGRPHQDGRVIADVDYDDAPQDLHDHAIYQLEGRQYQVLHLDHDNHKAYVESVDVDYYTTALTQTRVRVLERAAGSGAASHGEIHVLDRVVGFKKIKLHTHENVGYGDVSQPDREMHTTGVWLTIEPVEVARLRLSSSEVTGAALALSRALHTAASLLLMSERRDLGCAVGDARSNWFPVTGGGRAAAATAGFDDGPLDPHAEPSPTVFLFDRYRGGTGLAARLYDERVELVERTRRLLERCECDGGCPGCVGPGQGRVVKRRAAALAELLAEALVAQVAA